MAVLVEFAKDGFKIIERAECFAYLDDTIPATGDPVLRFIGAIQPVGEGLQQPGRQGIARIHGSASAQNVGGHVIP